jgi:ribosomal protein L7/L12
MPRCRICQHENSPGIDRCAKCGVWLDPDAGGSRSPATAGARSDDDLRLQLLSLLEQGQKIEAVKLCRERTGLGLKEAKDAVEALQRDGAWNHPERPAPAVGLDAELLKLLADGQKLPAIKLHRQQTGGGLKDSKDYVESLARQHGVAVPARGCLGALAMIVGWSAVLGLVAEMVARRM